MKWNIKQQISSLLPKSEPLNVNNFFIKANIYWELQLGDLVVRTLVTYVWGNLEPQCPCDRAILKTIMNDRRSRFLILCFHAPVAPSV